MFDIGFWEIIILVLVALLVVGPERLPGLAREIGRFVGKARRFVNSVRSDIEQELQTEELRKMLKDQDKEIRELRTMMQETEETLREDIQETEAAMRGDHKAKAPSVRQSAAPGVTQPSASERPALQRVPVTGELGSDLATEPVPTREPAMAESRPETAAEGKHSQVN